MEIRDHWENLIEESGRSAADLSVAIGKHRSYLSKLLVGKRFEPGAFTAQRLAAELGVTMEYLLGRDDTISVSADPDYREAVHKQASGILEDILRVAHQRLRSSEYVSVGTDMVGALLQWWHQQGGVLAGHDAFESRFDLINVPDPTDMMVIPAKVGALTLACQELGTNDPQALARLVETFDEPTRVDLAKSFLTVSETQRPHLSPVLSVKIPKGEGQFHEFEYFRLQLPVSTPSGDHFILNHCFDA